MVATEPEHGAPPPALHRDLDVGAALLDIDGTLVDSTAHVEAMWQWWAPQFGVDPRWVLEVSHGRRSEDTIADLLAAHDIETALQRLAEFPPGDGAGMTAMPGASELLAALPAGRWAAVTSGGRAVMAARLASAGLAVPHVLIGAEDVTRGKPDPEGYLAAARRLGTEPRDCLVIEDAPAGVEAGRSAGCIVLAVATTFPSSALREAHVLVPGLPSVRMTARPDGRLHVALDHVIDLRA